MLGFYGTIQDWVDLDLIAHLAERHPEWSIAMIGKICVDVSRLAKYPNIHWLGRKPHSELPGYCKGFTVGMIPYILNERILHVNPIKLREYLSAGVPVVSVALPEVEAYRDHCCLAGNAGEFERGIAAALAGDTPEQRRQRSDSMRAETWEEKVAVVSARVVQVQARKRAGGGSLAMPMTSEGAVSMKKVRVGLAGAGYISEFHVAALRRVPDVELLGIYDVDATAGGPGRREVWRYGLIRRSRRCERRAPNVIHVLTPPHTHAAVALEALGLGCHVLVEKPLAVEVSDCERIEAVAADKGLRACVNHSLLFDPQVRRALRAVQQGQLGQVVSVDILRSSDYPPYEGGPLPPQYRTAGYPFRDLGVHACTCSRRFLGPIEHVEADWPSLGGDPNLAFDEWRAQVRCRNGLGQFQLSWNVKPMQSQMIIHGTRGVLRVDLFLMFQALRAVTPLPKTIERVVNAVTDSVQPLIDVPRGIYGFLRHQVLPYHGLQDLVAAFYQSLGEGTPVPVPVAEAIPVVRWTEEIARAADRAHEERVSGVGGRGWGGERSARARARARRPAPCAGDGGIRGAGQRAGEAPAARKGSGSGCCSAGCRRSSRTASKLHGATWAIRKRWIARFAARASSTTPGQP